MSGAALLTFACFLWEKTNWDREYSVEHVNTLHYMLKEHCTIPHELVCFTNVSSKDFTCQTYPLPDVNIERDGPNCFVRLKLFDKKFQEKYNLSNIVCIDIDCVILNNIDSLFKHSYDFIILKGVLNKFNGSMWNLQAGNHSDVWEDFNIEIFEEVVEQLTLLKGKKPVGSDQVWLSFMLDESPTWGQKDGVYFHLVDLVAARIEEIPTDAKIVFFPGKDKPWSFYCQRTTPDLFNIYQRYYEQGNLHIQR